MAQISFSDQSIHCKIVYYGPPFSGKSTSLRFLQSQIPLHQQIDTPSEVIQGVPTVSFTYLTNENVSGLGLKLTLTTFEGTSAKLPHWKELLSDADGVIFVADSQQERLSENYSASEFLGLIFQSLNRDLFQLPLVFQYNKNDLLDLISPEGFKRQLINIWDAPFLKTIALQGSNVLEVLKLLISKILERLTESFQGVSISTETGGTPGIDLSRRPPKPPMLAPLEDDEPPMEALLPPAPGGGPPPRPKPPVTKIPPPAGAPVRHGYGAPPMAAPAQVAPQAPASLAPLPAKAPAPIQPPQPPKTPVGYKAVAPAPSDAFASTTTPPANIAKPFSVRAADEKPTEKLKKKAAPKSAPKKEAPPVPKTEVSFQKADEPWPPPLPPPPPPPPPPPEPPTGMFAPPQKDQEQFRRRSGGKPADPYSLPLEKEREIAADEISSLDDGFFDTKMPEVEDKRKLGSRKKEKREETKRDQEEFLEEEAEKSRGEESFGAAAFAEAEEAMDEGEGGEALVDEDRADSLLEIEDIGGSAAPVGAGGFEEFEPPPVGGTGVLREPSTDLTLEPPLGKKGGEVEEQKKQMDSGRAGALTPEALPVEEVPKSGAVPSRPGAGVRLEPTTTETRALPAKSTRANPFLLLLKIITLPVVVPATLVVVFWKFAKKQSELFDSRLTILVEQLTRILSGTATYALHELPWFEKLLSNDAGKPGPLERFVAHSRWLMWTIQKTIGTKFILISNALDMIIEFVASWIHSLFQAWQVSRTMAKAAKRKFSQTEIQSLCDELSESRELLSRLFHLSDYEIPSNTPA
ncbi:MAG: ADP-ribosylation factor-like protein [Planctomycetota bacterium]